MRPADEDARAVREARHGGGHRDRRLERIFNIDVDLEGLTELQSGSYCVMDLDYRRIGGPRGAAYDDFEMALTVLTTAVSVPTAEMAMVDGGFKAFSTDRPFVPEAVEWPGVESSCGRATSRVAR